MTIAISFDPTDATDVEYVQGLLSTPPEPEADVPAPKKAPAKRAPKKAAPEPEPEEEEEEESAGVTLEDAVARATELVAEGRAAEVKGALANFSVKRVSELEESQVEEFLAALSEDSVV